MAYHYYYNAKMHTLWDMRVYYDTITVSASSTAESEIIDCSGCSKVWVCYYTTMAHASNNVFIEAVFIHNAEDKFSIPVGSILSAEPNVGGGFSPFELWLDTFKLKFTNNHTTYEAQIEIFVRALRI